MPLLPPVTQEFTVNSADFMAGINEMIGACDRLSESLDAVSVSTDRLSGAGDAATAAEERMDERVSAVTEAIDAQVTSMDELAAAQDRSAASTDALTAALDEQNVALNTTSGSADKADASTGVLGTHGKVAFLALAAAVGYSVVKAAEFQTEMTKLNTQAGVAKSQLAGLGSGVLRLAGQVGESPSSLAMSLYHVMSNFESLGITAPKALSLVKIAAEGAQVGGADLVDVTNALTAAVASGIPGVSNFSQAMGALNAIVGAGDMQMQDLADAFGTGMVAVVKGYGLSLQDVGAALDVFGDNNIRGAKAGTDLRMSVQALASPVAAGAAALKALGMTTSTLAVDMRQGGLLKALDDLQERFKKTGVTAKEQGQVITEIFGKRAGIGVGLLMDQMDRLRSKYPAIAKGAHDFGSAWATTQKTVDQEFKEFKSSLDALAISFGQVLLPAVTKVMGVLNKGFQYLEAHPVLEKLAGAFVAVAVAMGIATVAGGALDAALDANPIMLVVLAVLALAAGLYELYKHCKTVRDAVADVAHFFESTWKMAVTAAGAVVHWFVSGPLAFIKQEMGVFSKWWAQNGAEIEKIAKVVWDAIATYIRVDWAIIQGILEVGLDVLKTAWNVAWAIISNTVRTVWDVIAEVVRTAIAVVLDTISVVLDMIQGHWSQAWNNLKALAATALHGVISVVKTVTSGFGRLLFSAGEALIDGLISGIKSMFGAAAGAVESLASGVVSTAKAFFHISSPSRVFHDIGVQVALGLAGGITATTGTVTASAATLAREAVDAAEHAATLAADRLKEMRTIGLGLRAGILASLEGTAADVKSAVSKIAGYIASAVGVGDISYGRGMAMTSFIERDNDRLQGLATKRAAILKTIATAEKYATSTASSVDSWTGLSNLSSVTNAANGGALYSGDILANLQANLTQIRQFQAALQKLSKLGLDKNLLNQIIQMGPAQGLQVAEALLEGPVSVIKSMNTTQSAISRAATSLGQTAADAMYDSGKQAGRGFLSGLEGQQKAIEDMMRKIAASMVTTIRRELGINSPSTVAAYHGEMWAEGLAQGIDRGAGKVAAAAARTTQALSYGSGHGPAAGAGGGGNTYYFQPRIELNGVIASDKRELQALLWPLLQQAALQFNKRNGGGNNGLSLASGRFG